MKLSVNWLKQYVDIDMSVNELVEKIGAQLGAVEEVIDLGKKYQGIIVAKVISCEKHPNADKLSLCKIDDGNKAKGVKRDRQGYVQVVCGAPNVKVGLTVAWLPPGTTVPSSYDKEPFVLEARELRGKVSNGMLASPSELTISDNHDGILELDEGKPGDDFAKLVGLNDYIIDVENKMFTHRPDCFGILGVAREVAGITGQKFTSPQWYSHKTKTSTKVTKKLALKVSNNSKLVPRFMAQALEGVSVGPSPLWMQTYLTRVGIRPINNLVDITNYTMFLTGQPLHAYDYDKLCEVAGTKSAQLETRLSLKGDKLKLLSGKEIVFDDSETILITSNDIPVGIGGVMGGLDTEVDENTKNIVMECANFDMYAIRKASMRHGLFTDAVTRFNKGQSPLQCNVVLSKAASLVEAYASGARGITIDEKRKLTKTVTVHVTAEFINSRLGFDMKIKEMTRLLENVEFNVRINGPTLAVTPPFWRTDIDIPEDIVEEVGRLYGFDHLKLELPKRSIIPPARNVMRDIKSGIREKLSSAGANEILSYSFIHGDLMIKTGQNTKDAYKLSNALSPDLQYYRLSLTPSLLDKIHANVKAGHRKFAIYELGKAHKKGLQDPNENEVPKEDNFLSLVYVNDTGDQAGAAYYNAKNFLSTVLNTFNVAYEILPMTSKRIDEVSVMFEPVRAGVVMIDGKQAGFMGEYKSGVRRALKLPQACAGFELNIGMLLGEIQSFDYRSLSKYPSISQDICLRVKNSVIYADLEEIVKRALADSDEDIEVSPVDIYQKEKTHKQITFRIKVTSHKRTLKDSYVSKMLDAIEELAYKQLNATKV